MDLHSIGELREDLTAADFTVDRIVSLWGADAEAALHRGQRLPAVRALQAGPLAPASTLAAAFVLGLPVPAEELEAALPRLGCAGAIGLGLVETDGRGLVRPLADLRPYAFGDESGSGQWWILSDLGESVLEHRLPEDHVLGVGGASVTLSGLIVPDRVRLALDLGTGCGIQALHLSRQAERVIATDISERAIRFARFTAALNGAGNIEFRRGSLFEPVAGERFDLIVSNPPFVITPRVEGVPRYDYRDGGMVGDGLVGAFVDGASAHLAPGGIAQFLGNWEYRRASRPEDGATGGLERVRRWIEDAAERTAAAGAVDSLDSWVIERENLPSPEYAETWIRDGGTRAGDPDFDALYGAWLDDFEARGVVSVGFGYVLLRRRAGRGPGADAPLRRQETRSEPIGRGGTGLGSHLSRCLGLFDWLAARDDAALAAEPLVVAPDVSEERHFRPGEEDPSAILLRQGGGFGRAVRADTALAAFVGACDGMLTAGAISDAIAQLLDADPAELRAGLLPRVRDLVGSAILLPA